MGIMIRPIQTYYRGFRFRSRLEARWAVFFDALGIAWEYEPEGFELSDGTWYLPDFWLPTFDGGMYAEVKPISGDFQKARQFCRDTEQKICLCEGIPAIRAYHYLVWEGWDETPDLHQIRGIPNACQAEYEDRMYAEPGFENEDLSIPADEHDNLGYTFLCAVYAARAARFDRSDLQELETRAASGFYREQVKTLYEAQYERNFQLIAHYKNNA